MKQLLNFVMILLCFHVQLGYSDVDYFDIFKTKDEIATEIAEITTDKAIRRTTTRKVSVSSRNFPEGDRNWEDPNYCKLHQKCVPYYLCKEDLNINSDGSLLIDERLDGVNQAEVDIITCPKSLDICCTKPNTIIPEVFGGMFADGPKKSQCKNPAFTTPDRCGFHNPKGIGGVINSMQNKTLYAQFAEFPWMMAVLVERAVGEIMIPSFQCGGSLIHPKVVLTTAHNIQGIHSKSFIVRGGEWNTQTEDELCEHVERKVKEVITHEQFTRANLQNDIALLILEEEFEMTPFINTVCLPPPNSNFDNKRCFSAGWGKHMFGKRGVYQAFLKKVELPIVPRQECQTQFRKTRLGEDFELFNGFLCAGGEEGKDLCTGDGGSPLMCEMESDPGHYEQVGIVAGGIGCNEKDIPGFYVDVSKYREWIDEQLRNLLIDPRTNSK